jgi:tetratricopeptide (TPR) repeat protein
MRQSSNFAETVQLMRTRPFPPSVPVIDLVSENPPFDSAEDRARWQMCHEQFAAAARNREGIVAYGSGHYIFRDNAPLVIESIVKMYSRVVAPARRLEVLDRGISYAMLAANESRRSELAYRHSDDDLNSWGFALLNQKQIQAALYVFRLNTETHPQSWKAHDSYAEALLKAGRWAEAKVEYQKSVDLNPRNDHGRAALKTLPTPHH